MEILGRLKNKIKPYRLLYRFYCYSEVLLWEFLVVTWVQSGVFGKSVLLIWLKESGMIRFITASSIRSVAETIGFGSILLVWIYAVLDKQELGLRYSRLLRAVYPAYHVFVIAHLVAILLCIGLSESGAVDVALVALIIVFWGGGIHCKAMFLLVFHSKDRRRAAADEWEQRLILDEVDKFYLNKLCNVTDVLGLENDPAAQRILSYFYRGLVRYAMSIDCSSASEKEMEIRSVLSGLAQVWDQLLRRRSNSEGLILAGEVMEMTNAQEAEETQTVRSEYLGAVCLAYVICVYRLCNERNTESNEEKTIRCTHQQLELTCLHCKSQKAVSYLQISKQLLTWMGVFIDKIPFDTSLFMGKGKDECPGDREMLYAMICLLFQDWGHRDIFDMICSQLFTYDNQPTDVKEDGNDFESHPTATDSPTECGVL